MQTARTLEHYWMPFTDNARFKAAPKLIASANWPRTRRDR